MVRWPEECGPLRPSSPYKVLGGNQVISPEISAAITNLGSYTRHVYMELGVWSTAEYNEEIASTAVAGIPHRLILTGRAIRK